MEDLRMARADEGKRGKRMRLEGAWELDVQDILEKKVSDKVHRSNGSSMSLVFKDRSFDDLHLAA
jgi:hypothetical protein